MKNHPEIDNKLKKFLLVSQKKEISEYLVYKKLAQSSQNPKNKNILKQISADELKHYNLWQKLTKTKVKPRKTIVFFYVLIAKTLGLTFATKLMEKGEKRAQFSYKKIAKIIPQAKSILREENEHEIKLLSILNEKKLRYISSIVLGLNDALIELTGALAGLTFAFQNARLIGITGLITGVAASLSMAVSEYISQESEKNSNNSFRAALYTGITYVITILFLVAPFFLFGSHYLALLVSLLIAVCVIFFFTFYTSVAQDFPFFKRFLKILILSLSVAGITFVFGFLVKKYLNLEI
jgi:VIT1/CCC1 family predicted Fe2+/Mn2+ transporter